MSDIQGGCDVEAEQKLKEWALEQYQLLDWVGEGTDISWQPIRGDAGFRRYYRLDIPCSDNPHPEVRDIKHSIDTSPSAIAVYAPVDTEDSPQFFRVANILRDGGVHAPCLLAHDFAQGFMLLEDLGSKVLLNELNDTSVDGFYGEAMMSLLRIQQCRHDFSVFPLYSRKKLHDEMCLFPEWFVGKLLGAHLSSDEVKLLQDTFNLLIASALEQPNVVVHRDFHSRNLMCLESSDLGVIDFQDAVIGPVTYDLASLLRDCYVVWDEEKVLSWALAYANMAVDVGILPRVDVGTFIRWFDWMGLQRHIKVLGIFARLSIRDCKHGYLNDIPLVIHYVRSIAKKYDELKAFSQWFEKRLMPVIREAEWMHETEMQKRESR